MKMKNMYGRQVRGIERSTFVIDREGRIAREWRGVKVPGHAQEVLDFVRSPPSCRPFPTTPRPTDAQRSP